MEKDYGRMGLTYVRMDKLMLASPTAALPVNFGQKVNNGAAGGK
jgi:hypothetical protein